MDNLADLWKRYKQDGDVQAREALILRYSPLVRYVVGRLAIGIPPSLQEEDLISYGVIGLIEALGRFDPDYGVKFETYAVARIRGQIIDSLRGMDMMPRSVYRQAKDIENAVACLSQILGRVPRGEEVAVHLGITLEQYRKWLINTNFAIVSLDQPTTFVNGEQANLYDLLEDVDMPTPPQQIEDTEMKVELASAIRALPKRAQLMISLYYRDGLTMKEVGQVLGVSESRVSQIHAETMLTLRGFINSRLEPTPAIYRQRESNASVYSAVS